MAIDLRGTHDLAWSIDLKPLGDEDKFDREEFAPWWARNAKALKHIHPQIAEQWIYRHWRHSPYCNIPIEGISWTIERWSTENLLKDVKRGNSSKENPSWDYGHLRQFGHEPAKSMDNTGTWNIPVIVLETQGPVTWAMASTTTSHTG
ncbi:MAG: hypothetical protein HYU58_07220 [Proteobacteria bacterium]|nr:hypothetical protein [Pseudomonadota bacterium]